MRIPYSSLIIFSYILIIQSYSTSSAMATLGGVRQTGGAENRIDIQTLGRFAVDEHNKKQNSLLEFGGVVNSKEQVVAGTMYYLTVEVTEGGKKKLYEAKVWVKPWMDFKELQDFKYVGESSAGITTADLGAKQGHAGIESGRGRG